MFSMEKFIGFGICHPEHAPDASRVTVCLIEEAPVDMVPSLLEEGWYLKKNVFMGCFFQSS